ncbi:NAD(P)H-dependent oxidoreductase subunit E [candidate division KSB1 bacterium]|nr:NAD(P)H-dependent oxidoreductase subunit E [candidate division KSB1 bacterium]
MEATQLEQIVLENGASRNGIIAMLQEIQSRENYLSEDNLSYLSDRLDIPLIDLYGIASFYKSFSMTPVGDNIIHVCLGTACHVRGAEPILEEIERKLDIKAGETTPDNKFTLKTVNCLGACALGPIVLINGRYFGNTSMQKVTDILQQYGYIAEVAPETT